MDLEVLPATTEHVDFAWDLYGSYVRENLFSGAQGKRPPEDWSTESEASKFQSEWKDSDQFIVLVDKEPAGWVSTTTVDHVLHIHNLMISPKWRGKKIASTLLAEMSKVWQSEGITVRADVLSGTESTTATIRLAEGLGAVALGSTEQSTSFQLN